MCTYVRVLSEYGENLTLSDRHELTSWLIKAVQPKSILNVNSHSCWEVIRTTGSAIKNFCDLYATLFCKDYNNYGEAVGYADIYFRATLPYLNAIYFDNQAFVNELVEQFAIPPSLKRAAQSCVSAGYFNSSIWLRC